MSDFGVHIVDKSWTPIDMPAGITFAPQSWDAQIEGGADMAEIRVEGSIEQIANCLHWLGYGAWIIPPAYDYVWWGEIEEISITNNGVTTGVTLEGVVNAIKVLYTVFDPGGDVSAGETTWAEDAESIALYGRRERKHSAETPMREAQANALRDTLLGRVSRPVPVVGGLGGGNETFATLHCVGFWRRLGRVYYENIEGLTEYVDGSLAHPLGLGFSGTTIAASSRDGHFALHDVDGKFAGFTLPGLQVRVSGMANGGNNKAYTVANGDGKEPVSLTASNIQFDPADDISESSYAYQLVDFAADDVIYVTGAASGSNNGSHLVKSPSSTHIEISPAWSNAIVAGAAGIPITIARGNSITVDESVINERTGASATVTAYGQYVAQRFQTGTAAPWDAYTVEIKLRKVGAPTDDIEVRLLTDSGGAFGTWVATATIANADISGDDSGEWVTASFDNNVSLAPGTWYWLAVLRGSGNHHEDYYEIWMDDAAGYTGTLLLHDGAAYQTPTEPKSLLFRVLGAVDTARQVEAICNTVNVFNAVTVLSESGIKTNQYRDGTRLAASEVSALLNTGDTLNKRLIATIGHQGDVTIRTVGTPTATPYIWRGADNLCTAQGSRAVPGSLPSGQWCAIDNPLLLQGAMSGASPFLIGNVRYSADGGWEVRPVEQPDPWAIGEVING
jgi:hypothetical protein